MGLMSERPTIFLSYARQDQARVDEYYKYLKDAGFLPWMDKYDIKGGQNWDFETKKALKKADIVVIFLSENSISHRGYIQREVKLALKEYETKLVDDIYIIPIELDANATIPEQLEDIHVIRTTEVDGFAALTEAINTQFKAIDVVHEAASEETGIKWQKEQLVEVWDGLPGYDFTAEILRLTSKDNPDLAKITDITRGWATQQLLGHRREKFEQMPDHYNFGQDKYRRMNSWEAYCGEPIVKGRVLSIMYTIWWYGAGAAHPNSGFHSFNFITDPLIEIGNLSTVFANDKESDALEIVQNAVREQALEEEERGAMLTDEWLNDGTKDWDCFANFAFTPEGLMILIAPYQIAPYAAGSFHALIDYKTLKPFMKPEFINALGIEYIDIRPWPFNDGLSALEVSAETTDKPSHATHLEKSAPHLILPYEQDVGEQEPPKATSSDKD